MATITKKDLIDRLTELTGHKRPLVKDLVHLFLDHMVSELAKGNRLEFRDFGVFETKVRAPRRAQNPKTLEPVPVPSKRTVKFKSGRLLKECLADPEVLARLQRELAPLLAGEPPHHNGAATRIDRARNTAVGAPVRGG